MDGIAALVIFTIVVSLLGVLDLGASKWGVDSRPTIGDDHAR
jgi:hypothetical protein